MNESREKLHRTQEFARLTGVTVRTLHHYDRLGLLKPSGRTGAGHRLYGRRDLARLQQIATLKFIGLPLKQIRDALDRKEVRLADTLRLQKDALQKQRDHVDQALRAIAQAEAAVAKGRQPEFETLRTIVEVIEMQEKWEFTRQYYSPEARRKLDERGRNFTPEMQQKAQQDWADLIRDVEAAIAGGEDPAGPKAQSLAKRWTALIEAFTGGDPEVTAGLKRLYADQGNWPKGVQKPFSDAASGFVCKAIAAGKSGG